MKKEKKSSLVNALINQSRKNKARVNKKQRKAGIFSQPVQRLAELAGKKNNFSLLRYSWSNVISSDEPKEKDQYVISELDLSNNKPKNKTAKKRSSQVELPIKQESQTNSHIDYVPSSYTLWLQGNISETTKSSESNSMGQKKKKKIGKKKSKKITDVLKDKIEKSVKASDEVVSETLAKLYVEQGYYKKAVKAYKKLSLKYPKKSGFFAAQIKDLKKKLK